MAWLSVDNYSQLYYALDQAHLNDSTAMYICICKKVTDHQIRKAVMDGRVNSMRELRTCLGACDQCGKCASDAHKIVRETTAERKMLDGRGFKAVA